MPNYPKHPSQWLGRQLAETKGTAKALAASSTQYVMEPIIRSTPNSEGHYYEEECIAIIGDLRADTKGKATGLGGWGIAIPKPSKPTEWVSLKQLAELAGL